jgi:hypothetical protein
MASEREQSLAQQLFGTVKDRVVHFPRDFPREVGAEVVHQVGAGAHELAAALFNGSAFVMYPRGSKEDQKDREVNKDEHGVNRPEVKTPETPQAEQQQERGGRSL